MAERPRKPLFPNPFYVALLAASTAFAITALAYLIGPSLEQKAARGPGAGAGAGSRALAAWFDRNGPMALGVEFVVMLVSGLLAMATDRWFSAAPARKDSRAG
jgi:hypothetical protein